MTSFRRKRLGEILVAKGVVTAFRINEALAKSDNRQELAEGSGGLNCCIAGFMSRCGAGSGVINQGACKFFKRSSVGDRCMHYCVSLNGHCDCVDAQQEMKSRSRSKN